MGLWEPKTAIARLIRGLEAGVVGGIAMLTMLISGALLRGYVWWAPANLLGSTFYGLRAFRAGLGWPTLAGAALHIVITGLVGAIFGLFCGGMLQGRRLLLLGALAGVGWHLVSGGLLWRWLNPLVPLYSPRPDTLFAHAVFGVCLGRMGVARPPRLDPMSEARFRETPFLDPGAFESHAPPILPELPPPLPPPSGAQPQSAVAPESTAQPAQDKVE